MTALVKSVDKNKKMSDWKFEELKNLLKKAILYVKNNSDEKEYFKFYIFDVELEGWNNYTKICS